MLKRLSIKLTEFFAISSASAEINEVDSIGVSVVEEVAPVGVGLHVAPVKQLLVRSSQVRINEWGSRNTQEKGQFEN
jgi:hypothetical protein